MLLPGIGDVDGVPERNEAQQGDEGQDAQADRQPVGVVAVGVGPLGVEADLERRLPVVTDQLGFVVLLGGSLLGTGAAGAAADARAAAFGNDTCNPES